MCCRFYPSVLFFFNDTATTEIYTLSLHDALPICNVPGGVGKRFLLFASGVKIFCRRENRSRPDRRLQDRKSTRLNSSHQIISYAVFCLKKKNHTARASHCLHSPAGGSRCNQSSPH